MSDIKNEEKELVTTEAVKDYLGIDWSDDMMERRIKRSIKVADKFLQGALGVGYPKDDERAQELALMIIADIFDHRELSEKEKLTYRKLAHDFELQIRLEMRE